MEYPYGAVGAGGVPLPALVDSWRPERHGVGVDGGPADAADRYPREAPSQVGQTSRRGVALYPAVGTRLGSRQACLAATAVRHLLATFLPALAVGHLEAARDTLILDRGWD